MTKFLIHPETTVGKVNLTVRDLPAMSDFYNQIIGLTIKDQTAYKAVLGTPQEDLVIPHSNPNAEQIRRATGLFHLAILVPDRPSLAHWLYQYLNKGYRLPGASDHGVSEALYLNDPEGNGIEIYRDRPSDQWPRVDDKIQMYTEQLDFEGLIATTPQSTWTRMPDQTTMGHIHLKVHDVAQSISFYNNVIGFEITSDDYRGAGFLSAGGYHHHLGMNVWQSAGAEPLPPGAAGLAGYTIVLPDKSAREAVVANIEAAGIPHAETAEGHLVHDPAGIPFTLQIPNN